ncbi:glycosyl hydrolase family 18 protein [Paenibacillus sp. S-38]|uniref:glycosyl hydrolase family 18 protein n=1 Tax=Paenibacillus sp. S-38 TaxID=3416710 RepID=UPI003CE77872
MDGVVRKRRSRTPWRLALLALLCGALLGTYVWMRYVPSFLHEKPDFHGVEKPVFHQGTQLELGAMGSQDSLKLALDTVKETIDDALIYESSSDSAIITTEDKVVRLRTSELTARINEKPFQLRFPMVKSEEGTLYLPMDPLKELYGIDLRESEETGAVILLKPGEELQWHKTVSWPDKPDRTIKMRSAPTVKAAIYRDLPQGERVIVWGEEGDWYRIQLVNGYIGYVPKDTLVEDGKETLPEPKPAPKFEPQKPLQGPIHVTWEHVLTKNPDTAAIGPMPGLDVISPTWFHIQDGEGNLKNLGDAAYANWAHERGYHIWGLFSNGFDPKRTTEALSTYDKRMKMIKQLLSYAALYKLQGINIDFENVNLSDKQNLVQFVRELTPLLHEQGLVVSMDVTPRSESANWSKFYDRKALAQTIDYMMLMAYDEHWDSSPVAGSVASLPWVEKSLLGLLEEDEVPPSKLILGIPFYTRVWTETVKNGKTEVDAKSVYMDMPQRITKEKKLTQTFSKETGQNYIEYKEDGKRNRIWIEDETSVKARVALAQKYKLAGVASWRRGYENPGTWEWIRSTLKP